MLISYDPLTDPSVGQSGTNHWFRIFYVYCKRSGTMLLEASGDMLAWLAIFADHIPDEWITAAAALSEKRAPSADAAYLLIWSQARRGWPFSAMSPSPRSSAPQHLCRRVGQ